ncbi:glycosyltransferase family 2 protein [Flavilitoribacter nigricans]|uniref:Glycosyltransferase 2-like domain-containing protein n=1 Tax=Flavilitoribacter nigricans (strain ATCC 23147 / DSM 23189 / NBRC 102662 / NCIMB 1420 / SS-2) TaxID=1122177 RepID=A0A2D0NF93_FLAN2|nr:glycosyltransferase family 2 protein [Flavilitoribacter nigricans]PHN06453.1 hypothetical protein CRP01_12865 [Flavilitoribacter nigricans DSM 23189 = NBRC 102662]
MKVAIILVNWNQSKITIRCVESLLQNTRDESTFSFQIIIVDNNSQSRSIHILEQYLEDGQVEHQVYLIKNSRNAGFAGGNNVGIRYALDHCQPDYIWLLNNDIIVQDQALNKLVAAARKYPIPLVWGSTIFEVFPELHFHCAGGFSYNPLFSIPRPISFSQDRRFPTGLFHPLPQMDYPAGASMFIRADTFREYGMMNEIYFLYYEELDFVYQIGGKSHLAWCPDSVLHHQSGKSTGSKNPNKGKGSWVGHYYGNLSALKFTWIHHPLYFPVVFFFRLFTKSFIFIKNRDFRSFQPLSQAYRDFFRWLFFSESPYSQ